MLRPEVLPQPTTSFARSAVGILITHSRLFFNMPNVWFRELITQPISGGSNSIIVCQDIVMTFACPPCAVVTSTTGPGSTSRYTFDNASVFFIVFMMMGDGAEELSWINCRNSGAPIVAAWNRM